MICLVEGLALLGFAGFYLYELVLGEGTGAALVLMSALLILVFAVALLAAARAWWAGTTWARTPTILWNLLLLPVAFTMWQVSFWGAVPLALVALAGIGAALASRGPAQEHSP